MGAAQIEVRVTPGMEVAGAAKTLAGLRAAILPGVVDDEHGHVEVALQGAEVAEDRGHLSGVVLIDPVQADEGVEHEQPGRRARHGACEAVLIGASIDPDGGGGDHVDGERVEAEAAVVTQPAEACLHDGGSVLGRVEQDEAGIFDDEAAECGRTARDRDGEVEGELRLAALGSAAEDADGGPRPERGDEPQLCLVGIDEVGGADERQLCHTHPR